MQGASVYIRRRSGKRNAFRYRNVPGIIGMAEAARVSCARLEMTMAHCRRMSEYITGRIMKEIENARVNGPSDYEKGCPEI